MATDINGHTVLAGGSGGSNGRKTSPQQSDSCPTIQTQRARAVVDVYNTDTIRCASTTGQCCTSNLVQRIYRNVYGFAQ